MGHFSGLVFFSSRCGFSLCSISGSGGTTPSISSVVYPILPYAHHTGNGYSGISSIISVYVWCWSGGNNLTSPFFSKYIISVDRGYRSDPLLLHFLGLLQLKLQNKQKLSVHTNARIFPIVLCTCINNKFHNSFCRKVAAFSILV